MSCMNKKYFIQKQSLNLFYKKAILKNLQYPEENICVGVSFNKERLQHRCFPVNIANF